MLKLILPHKDGESVSILLKPIFVFSALFSLLVGCGGGTSSAPSAPVDTQLIITGTPVSSINEESTYSFTPQASSSTGTVAFSITNKPSWATFDTSTGQITGTPDDVDVGVDSNITITATDDLGSRSIGPFSITVNGINDAPVINNQSKTNLVFSSNVTFNLTASDVDSATSSYIYSVQSQATYGSVVISNHANSAFEYQPSTVSATSGDSFTVQLSDGEDVSAIARVTLSFSDGSAPSITLTPSNGAGSVAYDSTYTITSDDPLDTSTLTYNTSAGACTGSVQISNDNFINCMAVSSAVASNLNRAITVTTSSDMEGSSEYKFKVTTGVANLFGDNVVSNVTNTFNTSANGLIITEISESNAIHDVRSFEVYNATSSVVDLSTYSLRSRSVAITSLVDNGDGSFSYSYFSPSTHTFSLPSATIQPGQYLIIRSKHFVENAYASDRVVYVYEADANDGIYPFWDESGFIEILKTGVTEDFVTFGASYSPTTGTGWSGTYSTALPSVSGQYGHSIGRDGSNSDTNSAADWSSYDFSTMGGANDISCNTDADADGIPDCSEVSGSTFAGLPLYDWGARTGQKDIFIEVDYMDASISSDEGIIPRKEALQKVVDAFAAQGIAVHFDVGDLYDGAAGIDSADFDLGGGQEVPFQDAITFSTSTSVYHYKLDYMDLARTQIFHYLIFGNTQNGSRGSSGLAELNGNDLLVTLGEWGLDSNTPANTNILINYQASTVMHELGHNLGLYHGGSNDGNNYEPNYLSIMNYLYQLEGLPTVASDEGDRFYYSSNFYSGDVTCYSGLSNAPNTTTFVMDFSHGNGADLNLGSLNETLGLGQASTDGVDFNCDGDKADTSVNLGSGTWTDYDDWSNINLVFQRNINSSTSGVLLRNISTTAENTKIMPDKVGDDRASVIEEYSPSPEFFERLRQQLSQ